MGGMTLQQRKQLAFWILAGAVMFAVYIAIPHDQETTRQLNEVGLRGNRLTNLVDYFNARELVHVAAHLIIFGGVAFLLGEWGAEAGSRALAWRYVISGAILMEAGQVLVGWRDDTWQQLIFGSSYDLFVDAMAAWIGLWVARQVGMFALKTPKRTGEPSEM